MYIHLLIQSVDKLQYEYWLIQILSKQVGRNFSDILNTILGHKYVAAFVMYQFQMWLMFM